MYKSRNFIQRFLLRFRFPVSLPEEIADALGVYLPTKATVDELLTRLTTKGCQPTRLMRFMPRLKAESAFRTARRSDRFARTTHFAYYFLDGWLEFCLHFDSEDRLRRLYIHHRSLNAERGVEIPLGISPKAMLPSASKEQRWKPVELSR